MNSLPLEIIVHVFSFIPTTRRRIAFCITCTKFFKTFYPMIQKDCMDLSLPISSSHIEACLKEGLRVSAGYTSVDASTQSSITYAYDFQRQESSTEGASRSSEIRCIGFRSSHRDFLKLYGKAIMLQRLLEYIQEHKMRVSCRPRLSEQFIVHPKDLDREKRALAKKVSDATKY